MIRIDGLSLARGSFSLRDVAFHVPTGNYGVLMGPSGSGKTSILEAICGLRPIISGSIRLDERSVEHEDPAQRGIGYVPQDGAIFPAMSVRRQIELPMRVRHWSRRRISERVDQLTDLLTIEKLLGRGPRGLSGGERQCVAIARAMSFRPTTLLLDEPMSALDDDTREQLYASLEAVRAETNVTAIHVTHNANEAARLGDVILRLDGGIVHRVGSPHERHLGSFQSIARGIDA